MQRTPRHFDGTIPPGKKIGDLLPKILAQLSHHPQDVRTALFAEWNRLLGAEMAPLTTPFSFQDGVFIVKVKSSSLYSFLSQYEKGKLLKKLQKSFPVRCLQLRIG